jgi:hypothetical protein
LVRGLKPRLGGRLGLRTPARVVGEGGAGGVNHFTLRPLVELNTIGHPTELSLVLYSPVPGTMGSDPQHDVLLFGRLFVP